MAAMSITFKKGNITVACDKYDWTELTVNGKTYKTFPASASAANSLEFTANYSNGSVSVQQAPMILNQQDPGTGDCWVGLVKFQDDGNGGVKLKGSVEYYPNCQTGAAGSNTLPFSANGLTGSFSQAG